MTRDLKDIIDSREDLLAEKQRLKEAVKMRRATIRNSFAEIREELNPFSAFTSGNGTFKNIFKSVGGSPLINQGIAAGAELLLKKTYLKRAGFLQRLLLPLIIKKVSEFIVAPKVTDRVVETMHLAAAALRKYPETEKNTDNRKTVERALAPKTDLEQPNLVLAYKEKEPLKTTQPRRHKIALRLRTLAAKIRE